VTLDMTDNQQNRIKLTPKLKKVVQNFSESTSAHGPPKVTLMFSMSCNYFKLKCKLSYVCNSKRLHSLLCNVLVRKSSCWYL